MEVEVEVEVDVEVVVVVVVVVVEVVVVVLLVVVVFITVLFFPFWLIFSPTSFCLNSILLWMIRIPAIVIELKS